MFTLALENLLAEIREPDLIDEKFYVNSLPGPILLELF